MSVAIPTEPINIRNLVVACSAITVFGLSFGMTYPLLSLLLEARGFSTKMIGINSAMMPLGILLFSPAIPFLSQKLGARNLAVTAAVLASGFTLLYKVFDTIEAWFVIRLLQGMAISTLFVLSETWIVRFAGDRHRGKVIAVYGAVLSLSFGSGPALVGWMGIQGWAPFVIGAMIILGGVIPLFWLEEEAVQSTETSKASSIFKFARRAPILLGCVFVFAILDAATLSLLPVYGLRAGLNLTTAALLLTALVIGNTVLQFPVGWLADKFAHRLILAGCAFVTAIALFILPFVMATIWMWPVVVLAGAAGYGVYTVALTSLGSRFQGVDLINGTAAFAVMWGTGAIVGSLSGGWSMAVFGKHGLPWHLAATYLLLVLGLMFRRFYLHRSRASDE